MCWLGDSDDLVLHVSHTCLKDNHYPVSHSEDVGNSHYKQWVTLYCVHYGIGLTYSFSFKEEKIFPRLRFHLVCRAVNNKNGKPI